MKEILKKIIRFLTPDFVLFLRTKYLSERKNRKEIEKYKNLSAPNTVSIRGNCLFGIKTKIGSNSYLFDVSLGDYSYFMNDCFARNVVIGKYCSIAPHVSIGLGIHPSRNYVSTHPAFYFPTNQKMFVYADNKYEQEFKHIKKISIGNDVWIGQGVMIMDGINIGNGAIIGAGAVIVKDVEQYSIVGGVPARFIRYRFEPEEIDFLKKFKWWDRNEEWLKQNWKNFSDIKKFNAYQ